MSSKRVNTPERAKAIEEVKAEILEFINALITDEDLDFDIATAVLVLGDLLSASMLSMTPDTDRRMEILGVFVEMHAKKMGPGVQFGMIDGRDNALDDAVESEGPGGGN